MPTLRDFTTGPWRAVPVLGVTQIISWGAIFYTPVLTVPLIAADRGWSLSFTMAGFSLALMVAGLSSPYAGRSVDRFGGHVVMTFGSLIAACGLVLLVTLADPLAYFAAWAVLGLAIACALYDPAFATLARLFGPASRQPITALTLIGGFASTVSWPVTHLLLTAQGWRGTYLVYAGLFMLVAAPLHAFLLPRGRAAAHPVAAIPDATAALPPRGLPFALVAAGFACYAFIPSALSAHLLALFQRHGLDAATAVMVGALFGPAQVTARLIEFMFGGQTHPLRLTRAALALLVVGFAALQVVGTSAPMAAAFMAVFGAVNGLITIMRGVLPLQLFGSQGYGRMMGRIATPFLTMQAGAPLVMALVIEHASDGAALAFAAACALVALACFVMLRRG
ncbi:MAG: MFS transporter [Xanthobacteraceae bacterium]|nr:MAG: MFS transporter [Xanthobacteraceae bacterium]